MIGSRRGWAALFGAALLGAGHGAQTIQVPIPHGAGSEGHAARAGLLFAMVV